MKLFKVADVLCATTGRLVSDMSAVYEIFNFLTGDNLFTHQLPRAYDECKPWLAAQYPQLMDDHPDMQRMLKDLDEACVAAKGGRKTLDEIVRNWVEGVRLSCKLPPEIPLHALGEGMHTRINPIEELAAMVGDRKVIVAEVGDEQA